MKIKKILIVDDTTENLEAAKKCFGNHPGFEFVYAADRETAQILLPTCDAMITDREIPFKTGETIEDYSFTKGDRTSYRYVRKAHGYFLLGKAFELGKPAIILSHHSDTPDDELYVISLDVTSEKNRVGIQKAASQASILDPYSEESFNKIDAEIGRRHRIRQKADLKKVDFETWELGLRKLCD